MTPTTKRNLVDLGERGVATFAQAFLAVVLVTPNLSDVTALKTAAAAGGLAVAKWAYSRVNTYLAQPEPVVTASVVIPPAPTEPTE